jgi:hypothetical protein
MRNLTYLCSLEDVFETQGWKEFYDMYSDLIEDVGVNIEEFTVDLVGHPLLEAVEEVVNHACDEGCDGDLTVTSAKAVNKLTKLLG